MASKTGIEPLQKATTEDVWIKTHCYSCPMSTCGLLVHRVDGVVVGIRGDPENPYNQGKLCAKAFANIPNLYDPNRPKKPLKRTNPEKGIGVDPKWVEISWEEAFDIMTEKLKEIRDTNPNDFVLGTSDFSYLTWFAGAILGSFGSANFTSGGLTYCGNGVHAITHQTMGAFHAYPDIDSCDYYVAWGSNKGTVLQHPAVPGAIETADARVKRNMKIVSIDPIQASLAAKADEWVAIRPGTDLAMALAWLNVLLNETGIYDAESLKKYTNGPYLVDPGGRYLRDEVSNKPLMWDAADGQPKPYDAEFGDVALEGSYTARGVETKTAFQMLKEHVKSYTPEWAAPITTLSATTIRRLATEFGTAARIGATIEVEGHTLPFRPACIHWYAGISQHKHGYSAGRTLQLINTVVGNLNVPGGLMGESVLARYPHAPLTTWTGKDSAPGEVDGLVTPGGIASYGGVFPSPYPARQVTPPATLAAFELYPAAGYAAAVYEASYLEPERFNNTVPKPKLIFGRHSSDLTNKGNPEELAQIEKELYRIAIEPIIDETAEFADLFIPAPVTLERWQLGGNNLSDVMGETVNAEYYCINFRQPVVPTELMDIMDIWAELSERLGILAELNRLTNVLLDLQGDFRLQENRKYKASELVERWAQSMFGPEYTLEKLAEVGHVKWRKTVEERYPRPFTKGRTPIYYEHFIGMREQVVSVTKELGFELDVSDYTPIPEWQSCPSLTETRAEYDLYAIPYRLPFLTHSWWTHNPWLTEVGEHHPWAFKVLINPVAAKRHGIKDADRITIESTEGFKVEGVAKLTECIHPDVIGIDRHGGHWSSHPISKGKGTHFNTLLSQRLDRLDPIHQTVDSCVRVKVNKARRS